MKLKVIFMLAAAFCFPWALLAGENDSVPVTFNGQVSAWTVARFGDPVQLQPGGRFVSTLLGKFGLPAKSKLDLEASLNLNVKSDFTGFKYDSLSGEIKPYRVWVRYSTEKWELRAGLQKISFGSAKLFRPLMWFDAMDVRDPLQLTDGVYGLLGKYFFENNANVWLWGLIGNKQPKGYELFGTSQWKPEVGGRFQLPAGPGEVALSANNRQINFPCVSGTLNESRIGLDGKWDVAVGLWFESSVTLTDTRNVSSLFLPNVQDLWNVGVDYTLPVGNGLGATLEYFRYHAGDEFAIKGNKVEVLGTMLTYPLSVLDNLSGMVFYLPDQHKWMNYLSWNRNYDNLSLYAIGFWNPDDVRLFSVRSSNRNLFAGKGVQLMVSYNF